MLRHTALFLWNGNATDQETLVARKGLAYLSYACPTVKAVDFGIDLLGGSTPLREVKPWKRTPLWHARTQGPPSNFDMALHLDFDDQAGLDGYNKDEAHHEVSEYNASICRGELTARVDWLYDGPSRIERSCVRHTSLFLWLDETTDSQKGDVREAFTSIGTSIQGLRSIVAAPNVGTLTTDYDLIVDVMLDDVQSAKAYLDHEAQQEAIALAAAATKYEWTARITHTMASG